MVHVSVWDKDEKEKNGWDDIQRLGRIEDPYGLKKRKKFPTGNVLRKFPSRDILKKRFGSA